MRSHSRKTLCSLNELAAWHSGMCLLAQALDQLHAETPLELADLQADRRLCQIETARHSREPVALDHLEQDPRLRLRMQSNPYQND